MIVDGKELPWSLSPLEALARYPASLAVQFMHSGRLHPTWSRYTILSHADAAYRFASSTPESDACSQWLGRPPHDLKFTDRPFADLRSVLLDRESLWAGYLSYDLGRYVEKLPSEAKSDRRWPIIQMHRCPGWLVYDGLDQRWFACGTWRNGGYPPLHEMPVCDQAFQAGAPHAMVPRHEYEKRIQQTLDYIAAGDVFQVNLSQRFTARFQGSVRALYAALADASPAWYGGFLELMQAQGDHRLHSIASTSPELFLSVDQQRRIVTRPIKGTRPADVNPQVLEDSEKDRAELNMIVDLLRNDLGRVCDYGSVRVTNTREIESHPTVHHGVATVQGKLHASKDLVDLLKATMPGGSITGAPKVRAMQIIDELEPVRRGPYCGAMGYVCQGEACFNIAIRTLLVETDETGFGRADFSVGGGIVVDSEPAKEYQETLDKAAAMIAALQRSPVPTGTC